MQMKSEDMMYKNKTKNSTVNKGSWECPPECGPQRKKNSTQHPVPAKHKAYPVRDPALGTAACNVKAA